MAPLLKIKCCIATHFPRRDHLCIFVALNNHHNPACTVSLDQTGFPSGISGCTLTSNDRKLQREWRKQSQRTTSLWWFVFDTRAKKSHLHLLARPRNQSASNCAQMRLHHSHTRVRAMHGLIKWSWCGGFGMFSGHSIWKKMVMFPLFYSWTFFLGRPILISAHFHKTWKKCISQRK